MIESDDWKNWDDKLAILETNWQDRMTELRNEYKDQFEYLYGVSYIIDKGIPN
jgi:hypothetical protein